MFDSTKEDLQTLLKLVDDGRLQLPDFQRDWVWEDDGIRSLLASIAKGFPIGSILTLDADADFQFRSRPLAEAPDRGNNPDQYLLDGQQRLTSLFQSLYRQTPVKTKNDKHQFIRRFYFLDIRKAVSDSVIGDDFVISIPVERVIKTGAFGREIALDLSTPDKEFEHCMFPLNRIFDERNWIFDWRAHWKNSQEILDLERQFDRTVLDRIKRYKVPLIRLDKTNSREAVCLVFEKVNTGGKKLDAFELLTAIFAATDGEFRLREDWAGRVSALRERQDIFAELQSTDFLQACTLRHTYEVRKAAGQAGEKDDKKLPPVICTRDALLQLPLAAYKSFADPIEKGFHEAGRFLNEQKIIWRKDLPYPPQLVTLAAVFSVLDWQGQTAETKARLARWFWCGVLGEKYGSATETRIAWDFVDLIAWIEGNGDTPRTIEESFFQIDRLDSLKIRISAAYKGLHALIMRSGCEDFINGRRVDLMTFFADKMDIHHIFPIAWCKKNGIAPKVYNSIVNKTPLSYLSNRRIGGSAPSAYLKKIEKDNKRPAEDMNAILRTHLIDPDSLRADDFETFYAMRKKALATLIQNAMAKDVVGDTADEEAVLDGDDAGDIVEMLEYQEI